MSDLKIPKDRPWDALTVTEDALPACVEALLREPEKRHPYLLSRLLLDHKWHQRGDEDGDGWGPAVRVMLALVDAARRRDPEQVIAERGAAPQGDTQP